MSDDGGGGDMVYCSGSGVGTRVHQLHAHKLHLHSAFRFPYYTIRQQRVLRLISSQPNRHAGTTYCHAHTETRNIRTSKSHCTEHISQQPHRGRQFCERRVSHPMKNKHTRARVVDVRMQTQKRCKLVFSFPKVIRLFRTKWFGVAVCCHQYVEYVDLVTCLRLLHTWTPKNNNKKSFVPSTNDKWQYSLHMEFAIWN